MSNEQNPMVSLYQAFSKAQAKMNHATKDATNPAFKSKYADLSAIIDATLPVLNEHGLSVVQLPTFEVHEALIDHVLITRLMHDQGGIIEVRTPIIVRDATNPQSLGSGITYARRYALSALCCIAQEDDDGNQATQGNVVRQTTAPRKEETKFQKFSKACIDLNMKSSMMDLLGQYGCESLSDLSETVYNEFYSRLKGIGQ